MDCTQFIERYSEYDDSFLSGEELSRFRAHLEICEECARYDHVLRKGRMLARQLPAVVPGEQRRLQLHSRIAAGRWRRRGMVLSPLASGAMAAVTILLVASSALSLLERPASDRAQTLAEAAPAPAFAERAAGPSSVGEGPGAVHLPAPSQSQPRPWGAQRVDRQLASAYSPLVTGPPAYRTVSRRVPPSGRAMLD